jgi:hypothetical protein
MFYADEYVGQDLNCSCHFRVVFVGKVRGNYRKTVKIACRNNTSGSQPENLVSIVTMQWI